MRVDALAPYEHSLRTRGPLGLRTEDGRMIVLDVARWLAAADQADVTVVQRCVGPVLDVGCGPGRFVQALSEKGVPAMGVDIAESAVSLTTRRGLPAVLRNVFAPLPGEGRWPTVLLMDGNIGIGGDPVRLLDRVHGLLQPEGRLIVEVDPDAVTDEVLPVRFSHDGTAVGPRFYWAQVGLPALRRHASAAGYSFVESWSVDARTFVALAP